MRYILTLFLIALVASTEIIDKADEIKEFSEYDDVQLQFLFGIIPFIGKAVAAVAGLFAKAKAFIAGTKVFKFVKGAITAGSKIFKFGKNIIDKGRTIYNKYKGIIQNTKIYKKVVGTIDKVKQSKIYQTYQKIKDTYNKGKDIYNKYFKKNNTQEEQQKQQQVNKTTNVQERSQAFQKYAQIRASTIALSTKKYVINNHLDYMLKKGFITPAQKQQMSNIN